MNEYFEETTDLLKDLVATPSFSTKEAKTADLIEAFLQQHQITAKRHKNNVWATNQYFDPKKPTILLNSHHDTVKPNEGYTRDPFEPDMEGDQLFGLGANDAGGALTALTNCFLHFYKQEGLNYNLLLAATAEEEISGKNGISALLPHLPEIDCAIVGEPTQLRMAVAEKGLMVVDCTAHGKSGHAARSGGENAIYKALKDINWIKNYEFAKKSKSLGPVKMTATVIQAGSQHNVIPDTCSFTVDIRSTDVYSNKEILEILKDRLDSQVKPRSTRLNPSFISEDHPLVAAGRSLGLKSYGSPTLSDQALLSVPSLKLGPGDSSRSHTADEFIKLKEIEQGISTYIQLLKKVLSL